MAEGTTVVVEIPISLPNIEAAHAAVSGLQAALGALEAAGGTAAAGVGHVGAAVAGMAAGTGAGAASAEHAASALGQLGPAGAAAGAGMEKAGQGASDFEGKAKGAGAAGESLGGIFGKVASIAGGFVLGGGISALPGKLLDMANAAAEDEAATVRLQATIKSLGGDYDSQLSKVNQAIDAGQKLAFSDDEIRDSFGRLAQATGSTDEALSRQAVAMDLARGANIGLGEASKLLGKVTDDNVQVLKRMGITLSDVANEHDVLAAVQAKFAGQSAAYANSTAGQWAQAKIALSETGEAVGYVLLPALTAIGGAAATALPQIQAFVGSLSASPVGEAVHLLTQIPGPVIAAGVAMAGAALAVAAATSAWSAAVGAYTAISTALAATNPLILAGVVAVGAAVAAWELFHPAAHKSAASVDEVRASYDALLKELGTANLAQTTATALAEQHRAKLAELKGQYDQLLGVIGQHGRTTHEEALQRQALEQAMAGETKEIDRYSGVARTANEEEAKAAQSAKDAAAAHDLAAAAAARSGAAYAAGLPAITSIGTAFNHAALEIKAFGESVPTPAAEAATRAVEKAAHDAGAAYDEAKRKQDDFLNQPSASETAARANLSVLKAEQDALDVLHDRHVINDADYKTQTESIKKASDGTKNYTDFLHDTTGAVAAVDAAEKSGAISKERAAELLGEIQSGYKGLPDIVGQYGSLVADTTAKHDALVTSADKVVSGARAEHDAMLNTSQAADAASSSLGGLNDGAGAAAIAADNAAKGINSAFGSVPGAVSTAVGDANDTLGTVGAGAAGAASGNAAAVGAAIDTGLQPPVKGAVDSATAELESVGAGAAGGAAAQGVLVGLALAQGVSSGIGQGIGGAITAATNLVGAAVAAARAAAGNPSSPSPVTEDRVGKPLGEGVPSGMSLAVPELRRVAKENVDVGVDASLAELRARQPELETGFAASYRRAAATGNTGSAAGAAAAPAGPMALAGSLDAAQANVAALQSQAAADSLSKMQHDYEAALSKLSADTSAATSKLSQDWTAAVKQYGANSEQASAAWDKFTEQLAKDGDDVQSKFGAVQMAMAQSAEKSAQAAFDAWKKSDDAVRENQRDLLSQGDRDRSDEDLRNRAAGVSRVQHHAAVNQQMLDNDQQTYEGARGQAVAAANVATQADQDLATAQNALNAARLAGASDTDLKVLQSAVDTAQQAADAAHKSAERMIGDADRYKSQWDDDQKSMTASQSRQQDLQAKANDTHLSAQERAVYSSALKTEQSVASSNAEIERRRAEAQALLANTTDAAYALQLQHYIDMLDGMQRSNDELTSHELDNLHTVGKEQDKVLEGAAATAHNISLQAGLDVYGRPTGGSAGGAASGGGGGAPAGGGAAGMSAAQAEDITNQILNNYISNQGSMLYAFEIAQQQAAANATNAQNWASFIDYLKAMGAPLSGDLMGEYLAWYHSVHAPATPLPSWAMMPGLQGVGGGGANLGHDALGNLMPPSGGQTTLIVNIGDQELVRVLGPSLARAQGRTLELTSGGALGMR